METKKKKAFALETATLNEVPQEERKTWWQVALIELGIYVCIPMLMLGGLLLVGMTLKNAIIAALVGYAVAAVIMVFSGIMGAEYGRPTAVIAQAPFGKLGSRYVMSVVMSLSSFGWFAVQNAVCGKAFAVMLRDTIGVNMPVWISIIIWGGIMTATAAIGIDGLKWLNYIAMPLLFIVFFAGMIISLKTFGTEALKVNNTEETISVFDGIVMTASMVASGSVIRPDISRFQKSRGAVWSATFLGMVPAGVILMAIGGVLSKLTGEYDITLVLGAAGVPALGLIGMILATWTTNPSNAYCAGLSLTLLFNLKEDKRIVVTTVAGVIGVIIALTPFVSSLEWFINMLGTVYFPIAGAMLADYWIIRKGNPENFGYFKTVNVSGFAAWLVGGIVTIYAPLGVFLGFFAVGIVYALVYKLIPTENEIKGFEIRD